MAVLTLEQLQELQLFDTPTVSNAIELFDIRPWTEGFMNPTIRCMIPYDKPLVGYACTARISSRIPPTKEQRDLRMAYYSTIRDTPSPVISVIRDMDNPPVGAFWGEVQASIHKALGCAGVITDGGVRDLDAVRQIGFGYFASSVMVSHAYVHLVDIGCPVEVGGLLVRPGDLIHADKHGALVIPPEIAPRLAEACRMVQYYEEPVIEGCKQRFDTGITIDELKAFMAEMGRRRAGKLA